MNSCEICSLNSASYKCPKCRLKYCSLNCFKTHQEKGCKEIKSLENATESTSNYKYFTEDTIPVEKLKLLDNSSELKNIINNVHVRDILLEIDNSQNVVEIIGRAMKEPIFVEFADICLKIVQNQDELNKV